MASLGDRSSDEALVAQVRRRQRDALETLYQRHANALLKVASRMLRDSVQAEEVVQEVMIRLWNVPERFDSGRGTLGALLCADVHNRSVDLIRSEGARRRRQNLVGWDTLQEQEAMSDAAVSVLAADQQRQVRAALEKIPDLERMAIELAYFDALTYREVAESLGEPEGTIKSRIRSGLRRLRTLMDSEAIELACRS